MKEPNSGLPHKDLRGHEVAAVIGGSLVLVLLMVATYYYPSERGEPPSLWLFIAFWLRELFIVVPLLVALVVVGFVSVWRRLRQLFASLLSQASGTPP